MANPKVEALRLILSKPLVPLAKKFMGKGESINLPQSSIINTSDDMTNALENIAYNNLITRNEFIPKTFAPREGLIQSRKTSRDVPVRLLTGRSNVAKEVPNTRKVTYQGLPLTPEQAFAKTQKSAQSTSDDMINLISPISEQSGSEFMRLLNALNYQYTPDYAQAAYRAVPFAYPVAGLAGYGAVEGAKNIYDYIRGM